MVAAALISLSNGDAINHCKIIVVCLDVGLISYTPLAGKTREGKVENNPKTCLFKKARLYFCCKTGTAHIPDHCNISIISNCEGRYFLSKEMFVQCSGLHVNNKIMGT